MNQIIMVEQKIMEWLSVIKMLAMLKESGMIGLMLVF